MPLTCLAPCLKLQSDIHCCMFRACIGNLVCRWCRASQSSLRCLNSISAGVTSPFVAEALQQYLPFWAAGAPADDGLEGNPWDPMGHAVMRSCAHVLLCRFGLREPRVQGLAKSARPSPSLTYHGLLPRWHYKVRRPDIRHPPPHACISAHGCLVHTARLESLIF